MVGHFIENELTTISVSGNGQSIYYARNSDEQITGVNRSECSNMLITLSDNEIQDISLLTSPDATLYPPDELSSKELKLKGFSWRHSERPLSKEDIFQGN